MKPLKKKTQKAKTLETGRLKQRVKDLHWELMYHKRKAREVASDLDILQEYLTRKCE